MNFCNRMKYQNEMKSPKSSFSNERLQLDREPAPSDLHISTTRRGKLYLMFRMLHSLSDGTSLLILIDDFLNFYQRIISNKTSRIETLPFLPKPLAMKENWLESIYFFIKSKYLVVKFQNFEPCSRPSKSIKKSKLVQKRIFTVFAQ